MNYGSYLSASGVLVSMRRMDVIANSLANANTVGFKPDLLEAMERPAERVEGQSPFSDPTAPPQAVLEKLGGGLKFAPDRIDFRQGTLQRTGNETDLAIQGDGFFVVADKNDKAPDGKGPTFLTRAGNFVVDLDGVLRMNGTGRALIGEDGNPVKIDPNAHFSVNRFGAVFQNDTEVARFRIAKAKDPTVIEKDGANLFRAPATARLERAEESDMKVHQYCIEESAADPITSMVELMRQSRLLEANVRMMQNQDNLTGQAITGITRMV